MHIHNNDGTEEFIDEATIKQFLAAVSCPHVKSASLYSPGSKILHSDGREYVVDEKGCWRKTNQRDDHE